MKVFAPVRVTIAEPFDAKTLASPLVAPKSLKVTFQEP